MIGSRRSKPVRSFFLVAFGLVGWLATAPAHAEDLPCVSTTFRMLGANDRVCVSVFDDPEVPGVACHISQARTGGIKGSLGLAPVFTIGNEMIISSAPPERAGAASAISETVSEFSAALGVAVFGSLGGLYYRAQLAGALPAGVSAREGEASLATLGGAIAAAEALSSQHGGQAGQQLLDAARAVFTESLQLSAMAGALLVLAASVLAARIFRGR